jgi:curved DNA-binding protein CbpA
MADYYQLLGIKQNATSTEIRTAYKKLAMLYHPDRNPGNQEAEELFKLINEAYHVLADPQKRQIYDLGISYPQHTYHSSAHDTSAYWRQYHRQRYEQWRQTQQNTYQFDKRYFKIQALAIGVFVVIAGFCFGIINIIEYVHNKKQTETYQQNLALIKQVNVLFFSGKQEEAFTKIRQLQQEAPLEYLFSFTEDSLILSLRKQAEIQFSEARFEEAKRQFRLLEQYENPVRLDTYKHIAECEYYMGRYEESLTILKMLLEKQPNNIELIHRIALIYQEDVKDLPQALTYLSMGRKNFKSYMTGIYGEAFELMMNPAFVHDIYFDVFERRAAVNIALQKWGDAEKDCSWAIVLRPQLPDAYYQRALIAHKLGKKERVCDDLKKAESLGHQKAKAERRRKCNS